EASRWPMVIEPADLTFASVPSWAPAAAAKPSAAAASRATAFFIASSLGFEKFYLVHRSCGIAQALGHGREQRDAERGLRLHQAQENVAVDGEQRAVGLGHGIRGARRLVDQRHLPQDPAPPHTLH